MNVFFTQLRRRAVLFGLLAVLLAAVVALQAISVAALRTVRQQIGAVSGRYTTIAVPREGTYWESLLHENDQPGDVSLLRQKTAYPALIGEDRRAFLKAHVTDCMSISAYEKDVFSIDSYDAFSCAFAVLAVRCTSVTELDSPATRKIPAENSGDYRTEEYMQRDFYASFSLEDVVCEFPAYAEVLPQIKIILGNGPYPADGNVPF